MEFKKKHLMSLLQSKFLTKMLMMLLKLAVHIECWEMN